jgi:hypothetical protein
MTSETSKKSVSQLTRYEHDLVQQFTTTETRTLGRQLVYFSFITLLLAGRFINVKDGIGGLKFNPQILPVAALLAGICCTYLLINFILYWYIDFSKWKMFKRKLNHEMDSPVLQFTESSEALTKELNAIIDNIGKKRKLIDQNYLDLGIDHMTPPDLTENFLKDYTEFERKQDELINRHLAFAKNLNDETNGRLKELNFKQQEAELIMENLKSLYKRISRIWNVSILVDLVFPLMLGTAAIILTVYKAGMHLQKSSLELIINQILE